jgi:hypothetical protein
MRSPLFHIVLVGCAAVVSFAALWCPGEVRAAGGTVGPVAEPLTERAAVGALARLRVLCEALLREAANDSAGLSSRAKADLM